VVISDVNNDCRPDIYVANDSTENHLYLNTPGGLRECGLAHGVAVDDTGHVNGSMGIALGDWDRSGRPSLFVTNFQNEWHAFYQNLGGGKFRYHSHPSGIARLGQNYVGFGTTMTDFDNDGWLDLAITNGHVFRHPSGSTLAQKPVLLRNTLEGTKRRWVDVTDVGGPYFRTPHIGRGLATADLDSDGWQDLVVSHQNSPVRLLRNMGTKGIPNGNRPVQFRLQRPIYKDMIGTRISVTSPSGTQTAILTAGGYLTSTNNTLHFGLGSDQTIDSVEVQWSFGGRQVFRGPIPGNRCWTVTEGDTNLDDSLAGR
jgi:enediyne biosynthesis protein E4